MIFALFAISSFLIASPCFSQELKELIFYNDDNERKIDLPGADCMGYLDDDSNFKIDKKSDLFLMVIGLGTSDRGSTLLVDCPSGSTVFSLIYRPRSVHASHNPVISIVRPKSSAAIDVRESSNSSRSYNGEIYDRSYDPFQITYRRGTSFEANRMLFEQRSVDIENRFSENLIGYGYQDNNQPDGDEFVLRLNSQYRGLSASHVRSIKYDRQAWVDSSWVRFPSPIGISLGQEAKSDGKRKQTIDRYFNQRLASLNFGVSARYSRSIDSGDDYERWRDEFTFRIDQAMRPSPVITISNQNSLVCTSVKICQIDNWILRQSINNRGTNFQTDYGIWPHSISAGISASVFGNQRFNMRLSRKLKNNPVIARWPHFTKVESRESFDESSGTHLEFANKKWTYFLDQALSVTQGKIWSNTFGFRFDGEKFLAGMSGVVDGNKEKISSLSANIRYFYDANLGRAALGFAETKISIKVKSNVPGKYVSGVRVELKKQGALVATRTSSPDGVAEFTEAKCCGDYVVSADRDGIKDEIVISISPISMNIMEALMLQDHRKLSVEFLTMTASSRYDKISLVNYHDEISESIISCAGCSYVGNDIYVPLNNASDFQVNEAFIPFSLRFDYASPRLDELGKTDSAVVRIFLIRGGEQ